MKILIEIDTDTQRVVPDWQPIATVPDDSTKVLVFSPKFGVWETIGRYALQPRGDFGWVPIAWKLSAQSSSEVLAAIAAAQQPEPVDVAKVEQETAEAIAKYLRCIGVIGIEGTAFKGVISGAWREYL